MAIEYVTNEQQSDAIILLKERLSKFETVAGRLQGLSYKPQANDVVIATTPKAGTTWVQQICHQIRCALVAPQRCMEFDEISAVVPWIELAHDLGQNLQGEQLPFAVPENVPRFFKTHCWYNHCPRFPKTIVVLRDPCDVLASFYKFFEGWFFDAGSIDIETFANEFWLSRGVPDSSMTQNASYFVHLRSWYMQLHDGKSSNILLLFFEDLQDNLEHQIRRIAKFVSNEHHNFDVDEVIHHATAHATFSFMKENEGKFDEKLTKLGRNEICGLLKDAGMSKSKIGTGKSGLGRSLPHSIREKIQIKWNEVVYPVTGCRDYCELRAKHKDD
jgi:Sulfotransferase domain